MSMLEKVRGPRLRPSSATPKERQAWDAFAELAKQLHHTDGAVSPMVTAELERLCTKGNPLALRFRELLALEEYKPRAADVAPLPPAQARRISKVKWGTPG